MRHLVVCRLLLFLNVMFLIVFFDFICDIKNFLFEVNYLSFKCEAI